MWVVGATLVALGVALRVWSLLVCSLRMESLRVESMRVWSPPLVPVCTGALLGCARGACGNERRSDARGEEGS